MGKLWQTAFTRRRARDCGSLRPVEINTFNAMKRTLAIMLALAIPHAWAQDTLEQPRVTARGDRLPAPVIGFEEFRGVYEADLPEGAAMPGRVVKVLLDCSETACTLVSGEARQLYSHHGTVQSGLFERTRRAIAQRFDGARLRGCINLASDDEPDGPFACRVDGMPGGTQPVLLVPPGPPGREIPLYPRKR